MRHFRFGLTGTWVEAVCLLDDYPMVARNINVECSQVRALNTILSNQIRGDELSVRNFEKDKGRTVLLAVFSHLVEHGMITRNEETMVSSTIRYLPRAADYLPKMIYYTPEATIFYRLKEDGQLRIMNLDTPEKRELSARLSKWRKFIGQQEIKSNLQRVVFDLFNRRQVELLNKNPLVFPDETKCRPYFTFNDKKMHTGGRLYGAWWVGTNKMFRRGLTINGEKSADIDGCGMHVQLLYRREGVQMPSGDPYLYADEQRDICKCLMLLMMNTSKDFPDREKGRVAVAYTYRRSKAFPTAERTELFDYMRELEKHHHGIAHYLYKSNWGNLQMTEAQIMMRIMEAGMADDIPILPVHDGCLCPRSKKHKILKYFADENINAAENRKHLIPMPIQELKELFRQHEIVESYV